MEDRTSLTAPVFITHTAAVTPLGEGVDALFDGLMESRSGISKISRFATKKMAGSYGGIIHSLDNSNNKPLILGLTDMLLEQVGPIASDTRLIVASTKAGIETVERNSGQYTITEKLFLTKLTDYISQKLKLTDAGININAACASSTIAIAKGAELIRARTADAVLICCMDIVSRFVFTGFSALGAMSNEPARPFDKHRKGLSLGEGAAAVVLMNKKRMKKSRNHQLAKLSGWGIAGDAVHLTAPARNGSGLKKAIKAACRMAGINPVDIYSVNTHGTGTIHNDAMELEVLKSLFDPNRVTANSIKGAIGHTLGAAGGIETVLCVKMIEKGIMVPTKGLIIPEKKAERIILREPRIMPNRQILTINSGFGGINAALFIEGVS